MAGHYDYEQEGALVHYREVEHYPQRGITLVEIIEILWGQRRFMALVFGVLALLGVLFAQTLETTYTSKATVLVRLGDTNATTVIGTAADTWTEQERVMRADVDIMTSRKVRENLLDRNVLTLIDPEAAVEFGDATAIEQRAIRDGAIEMLEQNFAAQSAPKSDTIGASFTHTDPDVATEVLAMWLDEYQKRRREVFKPVETTNLNNQQEKIETELLASIAQMQVMFDENGIADLDAEQKAATARLAQLQTDYLDVQTRRGGAEQQLKVLRSQISSVPRETVLYQDDPTADQISDLLVERERLLATYNPNAEPVRKIDAQIQQLQQFQAARNGSRSGGRKGPNPVYQQLQSDLVRYEADSQSLAVQESTLRSQVEQTRERLTKLRQLRPSVRQPHARAKGSVGPTRYSRDTRT